MVVAKGILFCLRCKAPQKEDSAKATKRFFDNQNQKLRKRLLATAAGFKKPVEALITADFRKLDQGTKKRGQISAEATVIRDVTERVTRDKGYEAARRIRVGSLGP